MPYLSVLFAIRVLDFPILCLDLPNLTPGTPRAPQEPRRPRHFTDCHRRSVREA